MKVWQLASIVRQNQRLIKVAEEQLLWQPCREVYQNFDLMVDLQNRQVLDASLPTDYVEAVLSGMGETCFLGRDGWLRSYLFTPQDQRLSFLEVFRTYGGSVLEETLEFGSCRVGVS